MKLISSITDEFKIKILSYLYEDELFNVFLIHSIENQIEDIGELYISESKGNINSVLHMKFDGNSYFTNFYFKDEEGLNEIIKQLQELNYNKVLLSGKRKDVVQILCCMGKNEISDPDIYYKFNVNKYFYQPSQEDTFFRKATCNDEDISKITTFLIGFFEPGNEQEIADLTNREKLLEDLKIGIYFIEYHRQVIGMARYSGKTKNYIDITTVYIDPQFRGKGFGKKLMKFMVQSIISEHKIPVTQTSSLNTIARRTYESLGFVKQEDYSFEFIS